MDWSKVHRKLAGRFRLLERRNEDGDCVIHCFGSLGQTGVKIVELDKRPGRSDNKDRDEI